MFKRRHWLPLALLILLACPGAIASETRADPPSPPRWERLIWWLPEDTETVIVAQGPFELPQRWGGPFKFREAVQFLPAGPALSLRDGMLRKELLGQKVLCAVEGSRRFTSPRGLGMMPYQGCHILQFEPTADDALRRAFRTCQEKADKEIELAGEPVAVFTEKRERDVWSYFVSRPRADVMIVATDQAYLEETLQRIGQKPEQRALPADLPEWKHVDVSAGVWAVRHYRKESAEKDPSSPLRPQAAENVPDPEAVGFVFWYSPDSEKPARARYLSGAKHALKLANAGWHYPAEDLTPNIRRVAPGVVEISSSVSKEQTTGMFLLVLMGYLGHGIYL